MDLWLSVCCDCLVMYMYKHKDVETIESRRCCLYKVWILISRLIALFRLNV